MAGFWHQHHKETNAILCTCKGLLFVSGSTHWTLHPIDDRTTPKKQKMLATSLMLPYGLQVIGLLALSIRIVHQWIKSSNLHPMSFKSPVPTVPLVSSIDFTHHHHNETHIMLYTYNRSLVTARDSNHRPPHPIDEQSPPKKQEMLALLLLELFHQQPQEYQHCAVHLQIDAPWLIWKYSALWASSRPQWKNFTSEISHVFTSKLLFSCLCLLIYPIWVSCSSSKSFYWPS